MTLFGAVVSSSSLTRQLIVPITQFRMGGTAPTEVTIGTTPAVPALLFNAQNELVSTFVQMPINWDRTVDVDMVFAVQLSAAETDADTLDLTIDYVVSIQNSTGDGVAKASTQLTPSLIVTTANGLADGDAYEVRATAASADATNPFTSSNAVGFGLEFHLTNVLEVGEFHFMSLCMAYTALH